MRKPGIILTCLLLLTSSVLAETRYVGVTITQRPERRVVINWPAVNQAQRQLSMARSEMLKAQMDLQRQFRLGNDFISAQQELFEARKAFSDASKTVDVSLSLKPDFVQSDVRVTKLERELADLRNRADRNERKIVALATELLHARKQASSHRVQLLDGNVSMTDAKFRLSNAGARMSELAREMEAYVRTDPTWLAARDRYESARLALASVR